MLTTQEARSSEIKFTMGTGRLQTGDTWQEMEEVLVQDMAKFKEVGKNITSVSSCLCVYLCVCVCLGERGGVVWDCECVSCTALCVFRGLWVLSVNRTTVT